MRSRMMWPVSLSSSYFFFEPFSISMTAIKSSGLMREGFISCQMFDMALPTPFQARCIGRRAAGRGAARASSFFHHNTALTFSQGVLRAGRTVFHSASSQKVPPRSAHTLQKPAQRSISRAAAKPKHRASAQWASALTVARMPFSAARRNRNGAG